MKKDAVYTSPYEFKGRIPSSTPSPWASSMYWPCSWVT